MSQLFVILKKGDHALELLRVRVDNAFERSYPLLDTDEGTEQLLHLHVDPCLKHSTV